MTDPTLIVLWVVCSVIGGLLLHRYARSRIRINGTTEANVLGEPSISFVFFKGNVAKDLPCLLERCRYKILETSRVSDKFQNVVTKLPSPSGPDNSVVFKAFCVHSDHTVLCDPEMVFLTFVDELADFCQKVGTSVFVAAWERISKTVALFEVSANGLIRQSFFIKGKARSEQIQPFAAIENQPDNRGLTRALSELGMNLSILENVTDVTVLKLEE
jgi:hypothetical protein